MSLHIASYNVNGIRAAQRKGLEEWVAAQDLDILCLQETKAWPEQVDQTPLEKLGYTGYWENAEKKGYSGVAIFTRHQPDQVINGMGIEKYDQEGRVIRADFGELTLLNVYFPSGTSGEARQAFKMEFLADMQAYINDLKKTRPNILLVGDYNIAHTENDIHDPVRNKKSSGFLPEERAWFTQWLENGMIDTFRHLHPDTTAYSWWSYRANARANNKGWRIDYQCVTPPLEQKLLAAGHAPDAMHSDHCPVWLKLDWPQ